MTAKFLPISTRRALQDDAAERERGMHLLRIPPPLKIGVFS
jgi:hypothetical protein